MKSSSLCKAGEHEVCSQIYSEPSGKKFRCACSCHARLNFDPDPEEFEDDDEDEFFDLD